MAGILKSDLMAEQNFLGGSSSVVLESSAPASPNQLQLQYLAVSVAEVFSD